MGAFLSSLFCFGGNKNKTEESNNILSDTSSCQKCEKLKEQFDKEQEKEKKIQEEYRSRELTLTEKCDKYEEELQDLRQKRDERKKNVDILRKREHNVIENCEKYKKELQVMKEEKDETMRNIDILRNREHTLREKCDKYEEELQDLWQKRDESMKNLDILRKRERNVIENCEKYKKELQVMKEEKDETMRNIDILRNREHTLIEKCDKYEEELQDLRQKSDESKKNLDIFRKRELSLIEDCEKYKKELQNVKQERDESIRNLHIVKNQDLNKQLHKDHQNKLQQLTLERDGLKRKLEIQEKRQNDGCGKCTKYNMELQHATLELEEKEKKIEHLSKRLKTAVSEQMNYSGHLSENIFDPCRESELLNMYRRLKKESWPHLKDRVLQFKERKPVQINRLGATIMKSSFEKSQNVMKERIENIMASLVLDCSKESKGSEARGVLEKVHENQKFLQMKVLSCNMNFLMESVKDICQSQNLGEKEFSLFQEFAAECFRVSALMCLHSPELLPSWETEVDGFNFITGLEEEMVIFPAIANKKQIVCPPEIVSYNLSVRK